MHAHANIIYTYKYIIYAHVNIICVYKICIYAQHIHKHMKRRKGVGEENKMGGNREGQWRGSYYRGQPKMTGNRALKWEGTSHKHV